MHQAPRYEERGHENRWPASSMKTRIMLFVVCVAALTFAQDEDISKKHDELAVQYAEAAAYFEIVAEALEKSGKEHAKATAMRDDAMLCSGLLACEGRSQEMAMKVTVARIELNKKAMLKEMEFLNANIAIVVNKYQDRMLQLMNNPPKEVSDSLLKAGATLKCAPDGNTKH